MGYGFDHDSHAPIVVLWWRGEISSEEVAECLDELTSVFGSWSQPRYILFDFAEVGQFDSRMRRQLASWRAKNSTLIRSKVGAAANVFTSSLARGYLTAVDWLRPIKGLNRRFFGTRDEALAWLQAEKAA